MATIEKFREKRATPQIAHPYRMFGTEFQALFNDRLRKCLWLQKSFH